MYLPLTIFLSILLTTSLFSREINLNNIIDTATKQHQQVFLFLHQTGCGYCDSMIQFTLDDDTIKPLIAKEFLYTDINVKEDDHVIYNDFEGSGKEFAIDIGYDFYPSSIFFNKNYEIIYAVVGYQEEDKFLHLLKYISSRAYKTMEFSSYAKGIGYEKKKH